jgi:glucokinase
MYIGIDLGGTKILTALADEKGKVITSVKLNTQAKLGVKKVIDNIKKSVEIVLKETDTPLSLIKKIGVGAPGPIIENGIIIAPPNLPGWGKVNIKTTLQKIFKRPVIVENDANAAALAEYIFGAGKRSKIMAYMTVSTGIGGGIIVNGKIFRGATGTAGEIGHVIIDENGPKCGCGNYGCLEAMAAGPAIARMAGTKDAVAASMAAQKGNKKAIKAIQTAGKYIGIGIADINNMLNPDLVVIGGGVMNIGSLILSPTKAWAKRCSLKAIKNTLKILPAKLKNNVGVMGAIALCMVGDD